MLTDKTLRFIIKPLVFALCLIPLALLIWWGFTDDLGANPIEKSNRFFRRLGA